MKFNKETYIKNKILTIDDVLTVAQILENEFEQRTSKFNESNYSIRFTDGMTLTNSKPDIFLDNKLQSKIVESISMEFRFYQPSTHIELRLYSFSSSTLSRISISSTDENYFRIIESKLLEWIDSIKTTNPIISILNSSSFPIIFVFIFIFIPSIFLYTIFKIYPIAVYTYFAIIFPILIVMSQLTTKYHPSIKFAFGCHYNDNPTYKFFVNCLKFIIISLLIPALVNVLGPIPR